MNEEALQSPAIATLREGDVFEGYYVLREASLHTAVNGRNYIRLAVGDATGLLGGNIWDANPELFQLCAPGTVVKIQAATESYKGRPQLRVARFRPAREGEFDVDSFLPKSKRPIDEMRGELDRFRAAIADPWYGGLLAAFFDDAGLLERFLRAPAAREVHHAWVGGLVEHTLNVARLAADFAAGGAVDRDLLLVGALLHDIGKIEELSMGLTIEYTDRGKLHGHLFIGAGMVGVRSRAIAGFPEEKRDLVQHLVLSHHGRLEYGSPVSPKIPEAFALHHLDNLDAKVETANRLIAAVRDPGKRWTEYSRTMETALYRAGAGAGEAADA
ncbi:MAG: HD domain-containing protein [Planctomycetota bacterium]|jgi:3'-5' exoribonuclease|nr:HD domain-containing protein [Planctomycetota bacterium]